MLETAKDLCESFMTFWYSKDDTHLFILTARSLAEKINLVSAMTITNDKSITNNALHKPATKLSLFSIQSTNSCAEMIKEIFHISQSTLNIQISTISLFKGRE